MMHTDTSDHNEPMAVELLPGEAICPTTHYSYNGWLPRCPMHEDGSAPCDSAGEC